MKQIQFVLNRDIASGQTTLQGNLSIACFESVLGSTCAAWIGETLVFLGLTNEVTPIHAWIKKNLPGMQPVQADAAHVEHLKSFIAGWDKDRALRWDKPIMLIGTPFEHNVWQILLELPTEKVVTYKDVAVAVRQPKATRAVGNAVGNNPISLIVPCHRVLPSSGGVGGYAWGPDLKRRLTEGLELVQSTQQSQY